MAGKQEGKEHADHIYTERVYDKMLRERGFHKEYDIVLDRYFSVKDNRIRIMESRGKNLVI